METTIWKSTFDDGLVVYKFYDDGSVECTCRRGGNDKETFMRGDETALRHVHDWKLEQEVHEEHNNKEAVEAIDQLLGLLIKREEA